MLASYQATPPFPLARCNRKLDRTLGMRLRNVMLSTHVFHFWLIGEKGVVSTACACEAHVKLCQHVSNPYHGSCFGMRLVWLSCTEYERPNGP